MLPCRSGTVDFEASPTPAHPPASPERPVRQLGLRRGRCRLHTGSQLGVTLGSSDAGRNVEG